MVIGPGRRLVPAVRFRLSVYHTTRFSTVFGLVWQRRYQSVFPNHWKMAVSVIRFLPYHVMRRLTFHCVAQQKPHNAFSHVFPLVCHPGTASLARQSAAKSGRFSLMERRATAQVALRMRGTRDRPRRLRMQTAPLLASRSVRQRGRHCASLHSVLRDDAGLVVHICCG